MPKHLQTGSLKTINGETLEGTGDIVITGGSGSGSTELPAYSTDEVLTAQRWVDGKPIYRKVVNFGALPNNTTKSVAHGVSDMETIWINQDKSRVVVNGTSYSVNFPNGTTTSMWSSSVDNTNFYIQTWTNRTTLSATITIEYTKTTDTASSPVALVGSQYDISSTEYVLPYTRNGKTVYGMEVNVGNLPNATTKLIDIPNYNSEYIYWIDTVNTWYKSATKTIPSAIVYNSTTLLYTDIEQSNKIRITSTYNASGYTDCKVVLNYTKN